MKPAHLIALASLAALGGVAWYLTRRAAPAAGQGIAYGIDGTALAGTPQNQSLAGPFNFGTDLGYNLGPSDTFDLSGSGQGSGFFSRWFQLSPVRGLQP